MQVKVSNKGNLYVMIDDGFGESFACMLNVASNVEKAMIINQIKREAEEEAKAAEQATPAPAAAPTAKAEH